MYAMCSFPKLFGQLVLGIYIPACGLLLAPAQKQAPVTYLHTIPCVCWLVLTTEVPQLSSGYHLLSASPLEPPLPPGKSLCPLRSLLYPQGLAYCRCLTCT